jgi:hypothetical protein
MTCGARVCSWPFSSSWTFWAKRVVSRLPLSTISSSSKLTSTTLLLACSALITMLSPPASLSSWSILSLTSPITSAKTTKVSTLCPISFTPLPSPSTQSIINHQKACQIWSFKKATSQTWYFSPRKTGQPHWNCLLMNVSSRKTVVRSFSEQSWFTQNLSLTLHKRTSTENSSWIIPNFKAGKKNLSNNSFNINSGPWFHKATLTISWDFKANMTAKVSIKCWKCTSKDQRFCGRAMKWCCGSREHLDLFWTKLKRSSTTSHFCKICALRNVEELRFHLGWVDTKMFRGRIFRIESKGLTWTTFRTIKTWWESHRMQTGWTWKEIVSCSSFRVCCHGTTYHRAMKSGI